MADPIERGPLEGGSLREGETIAQPEASQQASREQSVPQGVEQHPEAPKIPGYILTRPLGKGAFAQVWRAWQIRTRKTLAIKIFQQSHGVQWLYLQREVERLIRLDKHPNIVSLFDADLAADPPYYAMDLMEGGSLERYAGGHERPAPGAAARWAEEIADALAFVHAKGLLHCDLKPANVMLDEQGHVRVADFGQSRILTDSAGALGTLFYMAPEQAVVTGEASELHPDVRWDVFALGTTLYAVLTGRLPFADQRPKIEAAEGLKARLAAYRDAVAGSRLVWDSAAVSAEEDLRAIVEKCCAPEPAGRYESISAVKADLEAMRALMPVSPLAGQRGYRLRRFVQRRLALVVMGIAALAGLAGLGAQVLQARADAVRRLAFSYSMRGRQFSEQGDDASAAAYYAEAYRLNPSPLSRAAAVFHARQLPVPLRVYPHKWGIRAAALSPGGKRLASGSWEKGASLWEASAREGERKVLGDVSVTAIEFDAGGTRLVTADKDGRVRVWDAETGEPKIDLAGNAGEVTLLRFSPDGGKLLTAGLDRTVRLWSARDGKPIGPPLLSNEEVPAAGFSPDGSRIMAGTAEGAVRVWKTEDWAALAAARHPGPVAWASFSPDGKRLAALGRDGTVALWDAVATASAPVSLPIRSAAAAAFSPDGSRLVTGSADGAVQAWDPNDVQRAAWTAASGSAVRAVAQTRGGLVLAAGEDGLVRFWDAASGRPVGGSLRHAGAVENVTLASDDSIMTTATDGTVRLWSAPKEAAFRGPESSAGEPQAGTGSRADSARAGRIGASVRPGTPVGLRLLRHGEGLRTLAFTKDGSALVTAGGAAGPRVWPLSAGKPPAAPRASEAAAVVAAFSPDGARALSAAKDGALQLFDRAELLFRPNGTLPERSVKSEVLSAAFSRDGQRLAAGDRDGNLFVWPTGRPNDSLPVGAPVGAVGFGPDGLLVAAGVADGDILLASIEADGARKRAVLAGLEDWVSALAFSADGNRILAGSWDSTARIWDVRRCLALATAAEQGKKRKLSKTEAELKAGLSQAGESVRVRSEVECEPTAAGFRHATDVSAVAFDPSGRRAASADWGGTAVVWDALTGQPVGAALRHQAGISSLAFSPDGEILLTGGWDGTARFWDAETGEPIWRPVDIGAPVTAVAFSPDGSSAAAAASDGAARLWPAPQAQALKMSAFSTRALVAGQKRVDEKGDIDTVPADELPALREKLAALEER